MSVATPRRAAAERDGAGPPTTTGAATPIRRWLRWRVRLPLGSSTVVLLVIALSLMLLDLRGGPTDALRSLGRAVGGPIQSAAAQVLGPITTGDFRRPDTADLQHQVDTLADANRRLQTDNDLLRRQLSDAPELRRAAAAAQARTDAAIAASVVAADPGLDAAAVTLDAGAGDGVVVDSPVLVAGGLVGRVSAVARGTATVLLSTDAASTIAVRIGSHRALLQGTGDRAAATVRLLDPLAQVAPGDRVTTLGSDDGWPFPAGLTVGRVAAAEGAVGDLDRQIRVEPPVPLSDLRAVLVLTRPTDAAVTPEQQDAP